MSLTNPWYDVWLVWFCVLFTLKSNEKRDHGNEARNDFSRWAFSNFDNMSFILLLDIDVKNK